MKLLIALGLLVSQSALADAYYVCQNSIASVSVSPAAKEGGNAFTLRLSPNMPIVAQLGLPTTQTYALHGAFEACEHTNAKAAHAAYCWIANSDITAVGETDGVVTKMHFSGASVKSIDEVQETPWGSRALVDVQMIFDLPDSKYAKADVQFQVPLPGAARQPSECD